MNDPDKERLDLDRFVSMSDDSLLESFRDGSDDAATALYVRYASRLQSLADKQTSPQMAMRMDTEGVVLSVFRTFFRRAKAGQYEVANGEDLWNLFLVIALNKIRSNAKHHRAAKRDISKTQSLSEASESFASGTEEEALSILRLTISEVLDQLPDNHKDIVVLRIDGFEVADIAEKTGRAKRTVERVIQKFKLSLKTYLEDNE